jgi:hypothetical protein
VLEGKRETPFERFWSPVIKNPKHGLVYVGSNAVYALSPVFLDKYRQEHHLDRQTLPARVSSSCICMLIASMG